jgi:phage host-nuclease inhibitor protein Gam
MGKTKDSKTKTEKISKETPVEKIILKFFIYGVGILEKQLKNEEVLVETIDEAAQHERREGSLDTLKKQIENYKKQINEYNKKRKNG